VLVLFDERWHHGVIGISAARLVGIYGKPCIMLARSDGHLRGSARSVEGFSMFALVTACKQHLLYYGGHKMAAGMTLNSEDIDAFRRSVNEYAAANFPDMPFVELSLDRALDPAEMRLDMVESGLRLEPFGCGNKEPVYGLFGVTLKNITPVGAGRHLRLAFSGGGVSFTAMKFATTLSEFAFALGDSLDIAVTLDVNTYRGQTSLSVTVRDMRPGLRDQEQLLCSVRRYEKIRAGESLDAGDEVPSRDDFSVIYRFLRSFNGYEGASEILLARIIVGQPDGGLTYCKLMLALTAMTQAGLVEMHDYGYKIWVTMKQVDGKVDIEDTPVMKMIRGAL